MSVDACLVLYVLIQGFYMDAPDGESTTSQISPPEDNDPLARDMDYPGGHVIIDISIREHSSVTI